MITNITTIHIIYFIDRLAKIATSCSSNGSKYNLSYFSHPDPHTQAGIVVKAEAIPLQYTQAVDLACLQNT
jgi:hypothetical protein